ncbi:MAG: TetR/AcrR family transcriptional regulator [Deltaproteobacteria bacterium]|nr:TetR/AcrR family transcriptional regulator [Deltaproteobacteria bacterium]
MRLADGGGITSLSMRKLAQELGVEAMSLYNHVKNKDDLLDSMLDIVIGEIELPEIGGDWKKSMRGRALSAHKVLLAHPWAAMLLISRMNIGPASLRYVNATLGCLREGDFSYALADHAWNALDSYVYGFTLRRLNSPVKQQDYAETAEEHLSLIPQDKFPYLLGLSQEVMAGRHDGKHDLAFGLDLLLDGLEKLKFAQNGT